MRNNNPSIFQSVGNAFSVIDIAQPIRIQIHPNSKLVGAWESLMQSEFNDWFCIVKDSQHTYGYIALDDEAFDSLNMNNLVTSYISPISPDIIVPSTMSLLNLIPLFQDQFFFFVLDGNNISHVVCFNDLDKLPVKLCIFSLFMKFESDLIEIIGASSSIERYLSYLSIDRYNKALELCKLKFNEPKAYNILQCTTFIDKKTIIRKDSVLFNILPFDSKNELDTFFNLIEQVRNKIAHSDSILSILRTPQEFNKFIDDLKGIINSIVLLKERVFS